MMNKVSNYINYSKRITDSSSGNIAKDDLDSACTKLKSYEDLEELIQGVMPSEDINVKMLIELYIKHIEDGDGEKLKGVRILTNEDAKFYDEFKKSQYKDDNSENIEHRIISERKLTKEELAKRINDRQYGYEPFSGIEYIAKKSGLVIVYGASDDLMEFRGAIEDEGSCYDGGEVSFNKDGVQCEDECSNELNKIEAIWNEDGISWQYRTDIPHATFKLLGEKKIYCIGIVFSVSDLK